VKFAYFAAVPAPVLTVNEYGRLAAAAEHQRQGHHILFRPDAAVGAGCEQMVADAPDDARGQGRIVEHGKTALAGDGVSGNAEFETEPLLCYSRSNHKAVLLFT